MVPSLSRLLTAGCVDTVRGRTHERLWLSATVIWWMHCVMISIAASILEMPTNQVKPYRLFGYGGFKFKYADYMSCKSYSSA